MWMIGCNIQMEQTHLDKKFWVWCGNDSDRVTLYWFILMHTWLQVQRGKILYNGNIDTFA